MMQIGQTLLLQHMKSYVAFNLNIYICGWKILKVKVKEMLISIANICKMVTRPTLLLLSNIKSHMAFWLAYFDLAFYLF